MTALLIDSAIASPVKPRRRSERPASGRPASNAPVTSRPREGAWVHVPSEVRACVDVAPRLAAAAPSVAPVPIARRYEWTPRGLAVVLATIALVVGLMCATVVGSYLAITDAPAPSPVAGAPAGPVAA